MRSLLIRESVRPLSFDLHNFLALLGPRGRAARWRLTDVDAAGPKAQESMNHTEMDGKKLYELAQSVDQVIDGSFKGYKHGSETPFVIIRAIRSSEYEVASDDPQILTAVQNRFRNASDD